MSLYHSRRQGARRYASCINLFFGDSAVKMHTTNCMHVLRVRSLPLVRYAETTKRAAGRCSRTISPPYIWKSVLRGSSWWFETQQIYIFVENDHLLHVIVTSRRARVCVCRRKIEASRDARYARSCTTSYEGENIVDWLRTRQYTLDYRFHCHNSVHPGSDDIWVIDAMDKKS